MQAQQIAVQTAKMVTNCWGLSAVRLSWIGGGMGVQVAAKEMI
jgi:hypothetical protein